MKIHNMAIGPAGQKLKLKKKSILLSSVTMRNKQPSLLAECMFQAKPIMPLCGVLPTLQPSCVPTLKYI